MRNTLELYKKYHDTESQAEQAIHIHPLGEEGSTHFGKCNALNVLKRNGYRLPPKNAVQKDFKKANIGKIIHAEYQMVLWENYKNDPKNPENTHFFPEVYITFKISETTLVFPTDINYIYYEGKNPVEKVWHDFKNTKKKIRVLKEGAKITEVGDIKSTGNWTFQNKYKKGKTPYGNKVQFEIILHALELDELEVIAIDRETGADCRYIYKRDDHFYQNHLVNKIKRYEALMGHAKRYNQNDIDLLLGKLTWEDLGCLYIYDTIGWWGCPMSHNNVEDHWKGGLTQKWLGLCDYAMKFLPEAIKAQVKIGSKWRHYTRKKANKDVGRSYDRKNREYIYTVNDVDFDNEMIEIKFNNNEEYESYSFEEWVLMKLEAVK